MNDEKTKESAVYPDLMKMCRLCLKENCGSIDIFGGSENLLLSLRIMACTSLEVHSHDQLPKKICLDCRVQLEKVYYFQKMCKIADTKLRKHIRLVNNGKKSLVFSTIFQTDDEDNNSEIDYSIKFFEKIKIEKEIKKQNERNELEKQLLKRFRTEETERIFEQVRTFLNKSECSSKSQISSTEYLGQSENDSNSLSESIQFERKNQRESNTIPDKHIEEMVIEEYGEYQLSSDNFSEIDEVNENQKTEENLIGNDIGYQCYLIKNNEEKGFSTSRNNIELLDKDNEKTKYRSNNPESSNLDNFFLETFATTGDKPNKIDTIEQKLDITEKASPENIESKENTKCLAKSPEKTKKNIKIKAEQENIVSLHLKQDSIRLDSLVEQKKTGIQELHIFKCKHCPQAFTRRSSLIRHKPVHINRKKYSCVHCEKWFACKSSMDRHMRVHTGEKPFRCNICQRSFIQKEILKRHMITHTGQRPHKCPQCEKSFVQKQLLRQHINAKHAEVRVVEMHKCFLCPKSFYHASGLSRHLLIHSGVTYSCKLCNKKFNDKSAVKRHTISVHSTSKELKIEQ